MTDKFEYIKIDDITPNPHQPRLEFKEKELLELSQSIIHNGLIQPIIVRKSDVYGYELIAGERRLKASKLAGLKKIPAIIKTISTTESMQQSIIENLQRSDLNPIEEAKAYETLLQKNKMTHGDIANIMGKSRPYITNVLRLLQLPQELQLAVENGMLSQGHARLLLSLSNKDEQFYWAKKITTNNLSVRQLEQSLKSKIKSSHHNKDIFREDIEKSLLKLLGYSTTITQTKTGKITLKIELDSEKDLHNFINTLK